MSTLRVKQGHFMYARLHLSTFIRELLIPKVHNTQLKSHFLSIYGSCRLKYMWSDELICLTGPNQPPSLMDPMKPLNQKEQLDCTSERQHFMKRYQRPFLPLGPGAQNPGWPPVSERGAEGGAAKPPDI